MKAKTPKIFTIVEAKQALPFLKGIVEDIVSIQNELRNLDKHQKNSSLRYLKERINECYKELFLVGCNLKDSQIGLLGFYWHAEDNTIAELHWRLGEQDIYYWKKIGGNDFHLLPDAMKKLEENLFPVELESKNT